LENRATRLTCPGNDVEMMSELGLFCPNCGNAVERGQWRIAQGESRELEGGRKNVLCNRCYFDQFELVKLNENGSIQICSVCEAICRKNKWVDKKEGLEEEMISEMIEEGLEIQRDVKDISWGFSLENIDKKTMHVNCEFEGKARGREVVEKRIVEIKIVREICDICRKKSGGYYSGEIQIRASSRKPTKVEKNRSIEIANDVANRRKLLGDRNDFVSKIVEKKEGIDIRISTSKLGQKISKSIVEELGGSVSTSETLLSEDRDGNRIYRIAYLVRLPAIIMGDVIDIRDGGGPILIKSTGDVLKGIRLASGESYKGLVKDEKFNRIQHVSNVGKTSIVSIDDTYSMQILDPESYRPITIARPTFIGPNLKEVKVVKTEEGVYVLPNE